MDSLFERIENMGVKVGTVYLDREFFNTKVISKKAKHTKNGNTSTVFEYKFDGKTNFQHCSNLGSGERIHPICNK